MDAGKLGFGPDTVIQELGWDEDVDEELRVEIERHTGNNLVDGDVGDVVDGVILWWRDGDGDLVDELVGSLQDLVEGGSVWLLTPKIGRPGYVPGADVVEAADRGSVDDDDIVCVSRMGRNSPDRSQTVSLDLGSVAPDFTLKNQHGEEISLSSFRGDKNVVLVFFPFAFSGICTGEREIRDNLGDLAELDAEVLAISCDHFFSNRAFADRDGYEFSLLSDFWPHGEVSRSYVTFNDAAGAPNRGTFVIDREGLLRWQIVQGIGEPRNLNDVREVLADIS